MTTPAPSDKVKDKDYTNWLKVTLALYYMKSGLHTFVQSEIDCLHQSLVQKIYGGQKVLLPSCTICHASHVTRNKYSGVWTFQKQCKSYCDVWLHELLNLHTNPKSEKIYWDNSHVPSWPFKSWECAKIFLPKGQQPTNTGPAESDAQALMVLLANCKHFQGKLSQQGQTLTHKISTIRNQVMHAGEMKVSDANRTSFIQQIIQLLEDPVCLMSLEDCKAAVSNIQKIDTDSVDVFFNVDQEMTALRSLVNELKLEHGIPAKQIIMDSVDSLKEEYRQLREQHTKRFEDFEKELELHRGRLGAVEENVELHRGRLGAVEENVELHRGRLGTVEENVELHRGRLGTVEENVELHRGRLGTVEENVGLHRGRLDTVEDNMKLHGGKLVEVEEKVVKLQKVEETVVKLQGEIGQMTMESNSCMKEKLHRSVLNRCLPVLLRDLDFKTVSIYIQQKEIFDDVTMCDILDAGAPSNKIRCLIQRIRQRDQDTYEKFKECLVLGKQGYLKDMLEEEEERVAMDMDIETSPKKRPESDVLKQLKNETEDILDTFRKKGFIRTTQTVEVKKLLQDKRFVVISGNPGEGKTSTAFHLIDNDVYRNQCVVIQSPDDWKKVDTNWVKIVVLEDIFGRYDLDPDCLKKWVNKYLHTIQDHVDAGKLQVIITVRNDILLKAYSKLKPFKLFSSDVSLILSSEKLKHSDKMSILNRELQRKNKNMNVEEKEQCIAKFSGKIGFPQCCSLFAQDKHLFSQGPDFFKSPEKFLVDNIRNLEPNSFLSLAFLFCTGEIEEEYLSPSQIKESKKYLPVLEDLAKYLRISFDESTMISLRESYVHYSGLYVKRVFSYKHHSVGEVSKSCFQFSHATVYEAVGQVLGDRCPEMVVKHCHSEYLYQRTYTAEAKDDDSQNVFIPVSVYGLLMERMVHDVVEKGIVVSVVKHSALKQNLFLMKLKDELHKGDRIRDFLMAGSRFFSFDKDVSEGECTTFLQHVLQSDEGTVKLVYSHFMELLACMHNNNIFDCWQCKEKQTLLELAFYYHHFEIADKLIAMNACYTNVSLCNTARYSDLSRIQTIVEDLKKSQVFNPDCIEVKKALCRAYLSRSHDVIEILLKEGIILDRMHVVDVVQQGDTHVLMKVVEHLKCHNMWHPSSEQDKTFWCYFHPHVYFNQIAKHFRHVPFKHPCSTALFTAYCNEKFDMTDYLLKNEAKVSLVMLAEVTRYSTKKAVDRVIQDLKVNGLFDPHCDAASKVLGEAYEAHKYDVCDILDQEGVSITMKHFPHVILSSLDYVKRVVKQLKDTNNWDPKCDDASEALATAYRKKKYDVCDLLIQEGVSLTMKNFPKVVDRWEMSLESVKKAVKHLKDTNNWDPKCDDASEALAETFREKYDVCDLLIQEGVSLTMKNFPKVVDGWEMSLESVKKAVKHLKDTNNWDPKCDDASEALAETFREKKYDVCDLLIQEGVSLTMENFPKVVDRREMSLESVKKAVKHLKDTNNWDPKCDDASKALATAYGREMYDVCDLLIQEGVSLTMKNFPKVVDRWEMSLESVKKAVKHLKDTNNWDPKCDDASEALAEAFKEKMYDVCNLLVQEGVSLTMKNFPKVVDRWEMSFGSVKKAVKHLKDTNNWDPKCDDASEALAETFREKYDVCDLLIQEGVSLTMKNFPKVVDGWEMPLESVKKAVKHLKDTNNWDPKCDDASEALAETFREKKYDVCDLLIQEGVSLTMKNFPKVVDRWEMSLESVKKAVKHLKDTNNWDPKCDDASKALATAYGGEMYDVCDLLIQEGVSLTMKNFPKVVDGLEMSLESVKKAVKHLKDTNNWDAKCDDASKALAKAYGGKMYDVCDLLIQEGVSLTMKNFPKVVDGWEMSLESVKKAVKHLKDTYNWDPKCDDASEALATAYRKKKNDVCDLLIQEGVSLTMKNLPHVVRGYEISLVAVKKVVQHLKDTDNWDPKCNDASRALEEAYGEQKYDVCDLLNQEGVSLTMKNIPVVVCHVSLEHVKKAIQHVSNDAVCDLLLQDRVSLRIKNHHVTRTFQVSFETIKKAIEHLKDHDNWDAKSDEASEALANAYSAQNYNVCDLLLEEAVSLTMKNFPGVVGRFEVSLEAVKKTMQHLKVTGNWDPTCEDASKALANAYSKQKYDVCDLLIQEGVSLTMQTLAGVLEGFQVSLEAVKKALKHLKDTVNWDPSSKHSSKALENAYVVQKYDVCDLLFQEGVSLSMKNVPGVVYSVSLEYVKKAIHHLNKYDLFDLLVLKRVSLSMKNLPCVEGRSQVSLEAVKKVIQHLKDTDNWDPRCGDASDALANAYNAQIYDVCDLLVQEGVLPNNEDSSSYGGGTSGINVSS